jgi:hypothetical protein
MKEIQLLYKGKLDKAHIIYEQVDLMEVALQHGGSEYINGETIICFNPHRRAAMRVMKSTPNKLILSPADAEIFHIQGQTVQAYEEMYRQENKVFTSFKINTFATLGDDFRNIAVRVADVSRLGFGFEIDDFSIRMNQVYNSMIICGEETIYPKLVVRYAHILEKTIRYGAEIHSISAKDLHKLRYFIVTQQFALCVQ